MPAAFRFLDEFKLDRTGVDSQARSSTHLAFVQGNSKRVVSCFDCGNPGYTRRNCPRCAQNKQKYNKPKDSKPSQKAVKSRTKQGKAFAQSNQGKVPKKGDKPSLGFAQLATVGEKEDALVSHCFTTVVKEEKKNEIDWKEMKPIYSDLGLVYLPDENNIIG